MQLRDYRPSDFDAVLDLTVATFGPFYERSLRATVGEVVFRHQHGAWREDYRRQVAGLHDPERDKYVVVVEVVEIGTGGDAFHASARELYESLGCVGFPLTVYFKDL